MKQIFAQIITDFHAGRWPTLIHRAIEMPKLPAGLNKALVLMGMRRSGKTWTLYQIMQQLQAKGVAKHQMVYINFEDDRLDGLQLEQLQELLDAYFELYPGAVDAKHLYFFLDELQEVPGWEKFVRRLLDTTHYRIYISGSSAKMLSKEMATSLRGRTLTREIFPFDFKEYLSAHDVPYKPHLTTPEKGRLAHYAQQYLEFGGFPETVQVDPALHDELIQGYLETVIFRDIIERHQITNVAAVKRFYQFCLQNSGALVSINKMYQTFKTQGIAVSKNSLYALLDYFEDAYCLFPVPLFNFSERKVLANPVKIYPVDPGVIRAYTVKYAFERAAQLETAVFGCLRRRYQQVRYYKTTSGKEVDFVVEKQGVLQLFQVCVDLQKTSTQTREFSALKEAMLELSTREAYLITQDHAEEVKFDSQVIHVIPIWQFLYTFKG